MHLLIIFQLKTPQLNASSIHLLTEIGIWEFGTAYKGTISNDSRFSHSHPVRQNELFVYVITSSSKLIEMYLAME